MNLALLTLSEKGLAVARRLREALPEAQLHVHAAVPNASDAEPFDRFADRVAVLWPETKGLICILPCGVIVRALAPLARDKHADPAVVAVDVGGRWAVSLLSGHEGGANDLALHVANALDAEPVVTTTTEAEKDLIVGVGCRRGIAAETVIEAIQAGLATIGEPLDRVRLLASATVKQDEPGLREAAARLGLPLRCIGEDAIRGCTRDIETSDAAQRHVGLPAVAEPAALLAGRRTTFLLRKTIHNGVTIAIAREACPW